MKTRLSVTDWLDYGLIVLARQGFTALKADSLAKGLKVSRGSFYWHFADIKAYEQALIDHWKAVTFDFVVERVENVQEPYTRLRTLLNVALHAPSGLESEMRCLG